MIILCHGFTFNPKSSRKPAANIGIEHKITLERTGWKISGLDAKKTCTTKASIAATPPILEVDFLWNVWGEFLLGVLKFLFKNQNKVEKIITSVNDCVIPKYV